MPNLKLPALLENLDRFVQFVSEFAGDQGYEQKRIHEIELATEEALVNIFNYAYPDGTTGDVEVQCHMDDHANLVIVLMDDGVPFDLKSLSEPDLDANISDRPIGGLGVFLIIKMMDEVKYRRDNEKNVLTLVANKSSSA